MSGLIPIVYTTVFFHDGQVQSAVQPSNGKDISALEIAGNETLERRAFTKPGYQFGIKPDSQGHCLIVDEDNDLVIPKIALKSKLPQGVIYQPLEDDDSVVGQHNLAWLRYQLQWENLAAFMIPGPFAISDLLAVYRNIYASNIDPSNFRKLVEPTLSNTKHIGNARNGRNATLYNPPLNYSDLRYTKRLFIREMQNVQRIS